VDQHHFQRRQEAAIQFIPRLEAQAILPGQSAQQNSFWLVLLLLPNSQLAIEAIRKVGFDATNITTSLKCFGETSSQSSSRYSMKRIKEYFQISPSLTDHPKSTLGTTCGT
jgi:dTDP-4-amino-4,6-dideoxygalactose transaminase